MAGRIPPHKGKPKLTTDVEIMLSRGPIFLDDECNWPGAHITHKVLLGLLIMASDRRSLAPDRYRRLIEQLANISG